MPDMAPRPWTYRSLALYLGVWSTLVPHALRARWLEEWRSETWHTLQDKSTFAALRRVLGAPRDAVWSRRPPRNSTPPPPGSPRKGLDALMQDFRYAVRSLRRRPTFTLTALLMLAAGIGSTAALFGTIKSTLLEALPWDDADRLVAIYENRPHQEGRDRNTASLPDFHDWATRTTSFEAMSAYMYTRFAYTSGSSGPMSLAGSQIGWRFFRALGMQPAIGRDFAASDDVPGAPPAAIISHGLWQELLGGNPTVIGTEIVLNEVPHTVVGVLPDMPAFPFEARLWTPLRLDPGEMSRGSHRYDVFGRLKEGVSLATARAELDAIAHDLETEYPESNEGHYTSAYLFRDELTLGVRNTLWIVLGLAGIVLLIVCTNIANMQLANALDRQREIAVRLAIGATNSRVIAMVLIESVVLAVASSALGLLVAYATIDVVVPPQAWQTGSTIDASVFGVALALALLTSVLFGLAPALRLARGDVFDAIRAASRSLGGRRAGLRGVLVASEVAMAVVLIVGAGLLLRSLLALSAVDLGFGEQDAIGAQINLPAASYPEPEHRRVFLQQLVEASLAIPGVTAAGTTDTLPFSGSRSSSNFRIEGREQPDNDDDYSSDRHIVTPGYLGAMGIDLQRGRQLLATDTANAESVVVVNDEFAARFFPDGDLLGARISVWDDTWQRIVGVVGSVRHDDLREGARPEMYFPAAQVGVRGSAWLVMRRANSQLDVGAAIREKVAQFDAGLPVARVVTMRSLVDRSLRSTRRLTRIVSAFGTLAVVIAAMGLYGVISYAVGQRQQEIGLRLALGSTAREVVGLVVRQGMTLVGAGLLVGIGVAVAAGPLLGDALYGIAPNDMASVASAAALLGFVALLATLVPALRAARVDPAETLRTQ